MCIKTVHIDTYPDGTQKVYETAETCRPGMSHLCPHPRVKEVRRILPHKVHVVDADRPRSGGSSGIDFLRMPPSPRRSKSPSPSGSEGRRRRESGIYINGEKVVELRNRRSPRPEIVTAHPHGHFGRGRDPRAVDVFQPRFAPDPPSPRLTRSTTLPAQEYVVIEERRPHVTSNSGRRILREAPAPRLSRHASAAYPSAAAATAATRTTPFVLVDDEQQRAERARRAAERRASMFVNSDSYHRQPVMREPSTGAPLATSAAATAVRKELRWQDEERVRQNERIANRPPKLYQAVRGILKNGAASGATAATAQPAAVEVVVPERDRMAALRRSMSGLEVSGGAFEARRSARREQEAMKERLAARFVRPGVANPAGVSTSGVESDRRRGSRVYYPGEGLYKYM